MGPVYAETAGHLPEAEVARAMGRDTPPDPAITTESVALAQPTDEVQPPRDAIRNTTSPGRRPAAGSRNFVVRSRSETVMPNLAGGVRLAFPPHPQKIIQRSVDPNQANWKEAKKCSCSSTERDSKAQAILSRW